jgi:hypothetical protein
VRALRALQGDRRIPTLLGWHHYDFGDRHTHATVTGWCQEACIEESLFGHPEHNSPLHDRSAHRPATLPRLWGAP